MRSLLWRSLLLVVATAVLLELLLQAGAVVVYLAHGRAPETSAGGRGAVLCVGDSFTYGAGATTPAGSYPAAMQRAARDEHGLEIEVINAGWPGQTSLDIVCGLEAQLQEHRPAAVCIAVGVNDRWSRPGAWDGATVDPESTVPPGRGFRLLWRTGRLIDWVLQDGTAWQPPSETPSPWSRDRGSEVTTAMVDLGHRILAGEGLLADEQGKVAVVAPEWRDVVHSAERLLYESKFGAAEEMASVALHDGRAVALFPALVNARVRRGDRAGALAAVEVLQRRVRAERATELETVGPLLTCLDLVGAWDDALALARAVAQVNPDWIEPWRVMGRIYFKRDRGLAERAFRQYVRLQPRGALRWAGRPLRVVGQIHAATDAAAAARIVAAASLLDGKLSPGVLAARANEFDWRAFRAVAADPDLDDPGRALLVAIETEVLSDTEGAVTEVLEANLAHAVALCRAAGARAILVGYPLALSELEAAMRAVADRLQVPFVCVADAITEALRTASRGDLFVADGHCSDAGYAVMGRAVAPVVGEVLGGQ